jgi:hypothetical protein
MRYNLGVILWFSTSFFGCSSTPEQCGNYEDLSEGKANLLYEDSEVNYNGSWMRTGSTIQINLAAEDGDSQITIRLQNSNSGIAASDLEEGTSYEFSLGVPENANATFYPPLLESTSATTQEDSPGSFILNSIDETNLVGCFSFTAYDQQNKPYEVVDGVLNALINDLSQ